uniref:Putative leucine-rich repeat receptor-like protein kinase At4g00330 n=1 Tax=Anthurium amnicola TaxID=1678845 RepID=A0A1D1Z608_9ARAE
MQRLGSRASNLSRRKRDPASPGPPSATDFSRSSASTTQSAAFDSGTQLRGTPKSFKVRVQGVAGSCITCFGPPHGSRDPGSEDPEDDVHDLSTSTKGSTVSSNSSSKIRYSNSYSRTSAPDDITNFSFTEICKATGNFSTANVIGQGGFGTVYRGKLKDGSLIAVKRAHKNIHVMTEFKNEIQTLSKIEHLNLVKFLGYLEHADERVIVVEHVGNGNLREHLDGTQGDGLEMGERLDIAIDVAHAVTYLHMYTDQPVIHRDIKASNVLITDKLRAKVADFGFARLADSSDATHISTGIKGTAGYLDPEYIQTYQLTEKSDVYSFGVLLVELVSGRHPFEPKRQPRDRMTTKWVRPPVTTPHNSPTSQGHDLGSRRQRTRRSRLTPCAPLKKKKKPISFTCAALDLPRNCDLACAFQAMQRFREGNAVMAMDPRLRRNPASVAAVERVLGLAAECLAPSRRSRPSMKWCGEVLWGIRKDFREMELGAKASGAHEAERRPEGGSYREKEESSSSSR